MKRGANIRLPPIATTIAWQYDLWRVRATLLTAGAPTLSLTDPSVHSIACKNMRVEYVCMCAIFHFNFCSFTFVYYVRSHQPLLRLFWLNFVVRLIALDLHNSICMTARGGTVS